VRRNLVMAGAAAAAVAVITLGVVPQMRGNGVAGGNAGEIALAGAAQSGTAQRAIALRTDDPTLDPYFLAHGSYASGGVIPAAAVYLRHDPVDPK
jgi:hypothetical protein